MQYLKKNTKIVSALSIYFKIVLKNISGIVTIWVCTWKIFRQLY